MSATIAAMSSYAANCIPGFMQHPDAADNDKLWVTTYFFKKFVLVSAKFSEWPTPWATALRKVNDFTMPYIAHLGDFASEYAKFGAPFSVAFTAVDLGEAWNSVNYFLNGDFHNDLKKNYIFSAVGQILLLPTNVIGAAQFLQAIDLAGTLGGTRFFIYVEKTVNYLRITVIPGVASGAAWLSQEGWVNVLASYGAVADGCLLGAFTMLGLHGAHRIYSSSHKAEECKKALEDRVKQITGSLADIDLRTQSLMVLLQTHQNKISIGDISQLGRLKARWLKHENDVAQGKRDVVAAVSEIALKGALMAGVTSMPVLFVLGTFAFLAVGTSIYYRSTTNNPDMLLR